MRIQKRIILFLSFFLASTSVLANEETQFISGTVDIIGTAFVTLPVNVPAGQIFVLTDLDTGCGTLSIFAADDQVHVRYQTLGSVRSFQTGLQFAQPPVVRCPGGGVTFLSFSGYLKRQ